MIEYDESGSPPIPVPGATVPMPYPGDTGTSGAAGITSGVLGLNCGVGTGTGGGTCAAAPATDNSGIVKANNATTLRHIAKSIL